MLPQPTFPLAGQPGLSQNALAVSTVFLLSGRDWPRYLLGCSLDPLSTTPFTLFTVPWGATALSIPHTIHTVRHGFRENCALFFSTRRVPNCKSNRDNDLQ